MNPFALEIGGRNQNTQVLRSWCAGTPDVAGLPESSNEALDVTLPSPLPPRPPSFADFSAVGVLEGKPETRSNGFPGDLGVFAEPKDAKAPEPRPKALDAALVGDTRAPGVVTELKGFLGTAVLSPTNRLKEVLRPEAESFWFELDVERESLPEPARRLHKLSMEMDVGDRDRKNRGSARGVYGLQAKHQSRSPMINNNVLSAGSAVERGGRAAIGETRNQDVVVAADAVLSLNAGSDRCALQAPGWW